MLTCGDAALPLTQVCSGHGDCIGMPGFCSCRSGYSGSACERCARSHIRVGPMCVFLPGALASCGDGIMNGNEEGVDCGGPNCGACSNTPIPLAKTNKVRWATLVKLPRGLSRRWCRRFRTFEVDTDVNHSSASSSFLLSLYRDATGTGTDTAGADHCDRWFPPGCHDSAGGPSGGREVRTSRVLPWLPKAGREDRHGCVSSGSDLAPTNIHPGKRSLDFPSQKW